MNRPPAPVIPTYTLPGVLTMLGPTGPVRPLLLDSPHSGTDYPPDFDAAVDRDTLLDAVDTAVDDLFGAGPELGAALLKAHFPRTYIDPNRAVDDLDARILDGCWPGPLSPTEKTRRGNGLIRRTIGDDDRALYSRRLGVAEVQERIRRYHAPYHRALGEAQDRLMERFGAVYHLNCHSMGSRSREDMTRRPVGVGRAGQVVGQEQAVAEFGVEPGARLPDAVTPVDQRARPRAPHPGALSPGAP